MTGKKIFWLSLLFFAFTRIIALTQLEMVFSDTYFYYTRATFGILQGYIAYEEYAFPYPPLALVFCYLPIQPEQKFIEYRSIFQYQMVVFDILCLLFMYLFLHKRLQISQAKINYAIILYSIMGLLLGHLIYDRIDIVIAMTLMASLYFFTGENTKAHILCYIFMLLGFLTKLLTLFWLPIFFVGEFFRSKKHLQNTIVLMGVFILPALVFMLVYDYSVEGGLFKGLSDHKQRGIQIESNWSIPLLLAKKFASGYDIAMEENYGAMHLKGKSISKFYVFLSKYMGFTLLSCFYLAFLWWGWKNYKKDFPLRISAIVYTVVCTIVLLFLLVLQRVLSPQYFIWLLPLFCILIAYDPRNLLFTFVVIAIYLLTGVSFAHYQNFMDLEIHFVIIVALRNLLMTTLFIGFLVFAFKKSTMIGKCENA